METVVTALHRPTGEIRKPHAAGTNVDRLATRPLREPDSADRHIRFAFTSSIWCGAMVGCIGAAVIPPWLNQ